jgi:hypothetical protein
MVKKYPDASSTIKILFKLLCDIKELAGCTPASVGKSVEWATISNYTEENHLNYCNVLNGKTLFIANMDTDSTGTESMPGD